MAIPQHADSDQARWCPVCGSLTHPHHLVCRQCGAIMLLSRSEQPGRWKRHQRWMRLRTALLVMIGLTAIASLLTGLYVTMNDIPGCDSRLPLLGAIACTTDHHDERATFVSAALTYESTRQAPHTPARLERTHAMTLRAYDKLYATSTSACRLLLERWRSTHEQAPAGTTLAMVDHINRSC